jgi:hypothetical protein
MEDYTISTKGPKFQQAKVQKKNASRCCAPLGKNLFFRERIAEGAKISDNGHKNGLDKEPKAGSQSGWQGR